MGEKFRAEKTKLKGMNFREKREYIWEYYKIPIILIVLFLLTAGSLINTWFINPPKNEYLYIAWMGGYADDAQLQALSDTLSAAITDDPEKEMVQVSAFYYGEDPQFNTATSERLVAQVAAGQIDVMVLSPEFVENMARAGFIAPLGAFLSELKAADSGLYQELSGKEMYAEYELEDETLADAAFGLPVGSCPLFASLGFYEQDLYFCQIINTQKIGQAVKALGKLYG